MNLYQLSEREKSILRYVIHQFILTASPVGSRNISKKYDVNHKPDGWENSIGEELLKVHKSYLKLISLLKENIEIKAFSHITGGGILGNTKRVVPDNLTLDIDWKSWQVPPLFKLIQETGNISDEEMRKAFNMGIGLIAIINPKDETKLIDLSKSLEENSIKIGKLI